MSPIPKSEWPTSPMMSPAYASFTVSRSLPKSRCELARRTFFPVREWVTVMSRSNLPEQMRMYAMRSRCFGSMFAWILKMKPENASSLGSINSPPTSRPCGGGAWCRKPLRISSTPKLFIALPKNTGVVFPLRISALSNAAPAISSISSSSVTLAKVASGTRSLTKSSVMLPTSTGAMYAPPVVRSNKCTCLAKRSNTPLNSAPSPIGQFTGNGLSCSTLSISSSNSIAPFDGRSHLLMNVKIGTPRWRQTSNNFCVCTSMPLAASSTITTASTAVSTRYVSSEKSLCPGVSSRLIWYPS